MKNKGITTILLIAVACIWGMLIFKIYHAISNNTHSPFHVAEHPAIKNDTVKSYQLHSYTRDPFLSILKDTITLPPSPIVPSTPQHKETIEKRPLILPLYCGLIRTNEVKTAILRMDKKTYFIHEGETFQSIKIKSIDVDSVMASSDGLKVVLPLYRRKR
ncbi:MAG TPA: hypothetical protein VHA52_06365 [Candidatus Babeliaceae bacterium]|nr:hypothetical protein [Candidatus Babeliaceae bacterium]